MSGVTLHMGDCATVMAERIADNSIDLTVTSPPYDNLRTYNGYTFDFEAIGAQLWRVTKPGGVVVWVVGDATVNGSETGTSFRQALHFMSLGFNLYDTMIWDKTVPTTPTEGRYYNTFEYMFVFSKGRPFAINYIEDRLNASAGVARINLKNCRKEKRTYGGKATVTAAKGRRFNVWPINPSARPIDHPAPFPEALARDHILSWSNPGDVVLDPMMGSGTTGKMARLTGRQFIGIDISAEYVELARQRIAKVELQPFLFHPAEATVQPEQLPLDSREFSCYAETVNRVQPE